MTHPLTRAVACEAPARLRSPSRFRMLVREYLDSRSDLDPSGVPYTFTCVDRGIVVHSRGADRIAGTSDDIWSDDR